MREINFDGLIGPTHGYAGLSHGNVASSSNRGQISRPREAALQGLAKMRALLGLGVLQGVLPPHERPHLPTLRRLGFRGTPGEVLKWASAHPLLLAASSSASAMWTANAATVSPSADTADGKVHLTPANLSAKLHRAIEPEQTARALQRIFTSEHFVHHEPVPGTLGDEGAANHTRFCRGDVGVELFVYGRDAFGPRNGDAATPKRFPARQAREASEVVARTHGLDPARTVFVRQSARAIDAGVFHNDVIAVGHEQVHLAHEHAFEDPDAIQQIEKTCADFGIALQTVVVRESELPLAEAVRSYLFNSQLVSAEQGLTLVAPIECGEGPTRSLLDALPGRSPIKHVALLDVRQSMRNGGGPACLRLRVALNEEERAGVHAPCVLDEDKIAALEAWVRAHYREELSPKDLGDPALLHEVYAALDALTSLLSLGSDFYEFQR